MACEPISAALESLNSCTAMELHLHWLFVDTVHLHWKLVLLLPKLSWGALAWYPALLVLNALAFLGVAKLTNCKKRVAGIQLTELDAEVLQLEDAASVRQKDEETELNVIVQKDEETELDVIVQQQSTRRQN